MEVLEVAEVARYLSETLRADPILADCWIRGQIGNLSRSANGHYYFSLCGPASQLQCVLFRGNALRLAAPPRPGDEVVLHGRFGFYEARGSCQVNVDLLFPAGLGQARLELEALRARLEQEGLFALERKRALPAFPRRIGLVTSESGAVLHDIVQVLSRRYPLVELVLSATAVQGERAPAEVCAALERLARHHRDEQPLDLIIVARGGGSEQELGVFNDERVVRACYASPVPIVSAIGHETDVTLVDFVADLRAPTPSAAAELVAPDVGTLRELTSDLARRARAAAQLALQRARLQLRSANDRLQAQSPGAALVQRRERVRSAVERGRSALTQRLAVEREHLSGRALQLDALSPLGTLERGYAICTLETGLVLRSVRDAAAGTLIDIRLRDGLVSGRAERSRPVDGSMVGAGRREGD